jgi:hypothetical protein
LRGIESELDGGLESRLSEVGEEVADLLFGLIDDGPRLSGIDGGSDIDAELIEAVAQEGAKVVSGQLRWRVHGKPRKRDWRLRRDGDRRTPVW